MLFLTIVAGASAIMSVSGWWMATLCGKRVMANTWALAGLLLPLAAAILWQGASVVGDTMDAGSLDGVPTCNSSMANRMVADGIRSSPVGLAMHVRVLGISQAHETLYSEGIRHCSAQVSLDISSTPRTATYAIERDGTNHVLLDVSVE